MIESPATTYNVFFDFEMVVYDLFNSVLVMLSSSEAVCNGMRLSQA